jgi:mRNA interferase RelE/StbE
MSFRVIIKPSALREINHLPVVFQDQIIPAIEILASDPRPIGCKKLIGSKSRWRIKTGDYRILYELDDSRNQIYVYRVAHRKDVYR